MEGEKSSGVGVSPPISIGRLVLMLTTVGQQYLFLQQHDIIPSTGVCHKPTKYTSEVRIPLLVAHVLGAVPGKNVPYGRSNCNYGSECRWPPL